MFAVHHIDVQLPNIVQLFWNMTKLSAFKRDNPTVLMWLRIY